MTLSPPFPDNLPMPPDVDPSDLLRAWRLVRPDLRSRDGYRYPWPGNWAVAPDDGRSLERTGDPCPSSSHGGLCLAKTLTGARSGSHPLTTGLSCLYLAEDVLGEDPDKIRVRRLWVADVFDVRAWLQDSRANLTGADLTRAYLTRADLTGADLTRAYLTRADLTRADLTGAYLTRADLTGAYLTRADLTGADLTRAYLTGANLTGARYTQLTIWPARFDPKAAGAVDVTPITVTA